MGGAGLLLIELRYVNLRYRVRKTNGRFESYIAPYILFGDADPLARADNINS